jgi:hypothetical protein
MAYTDAISVFGFPRAGALSYTQVFFKVEKNPIPSSLGTKGRHAFSKSLSSRRKERTHWGIGFLSRCQKNRRLKSERHLCITMSALAWEPRIGAYAPSTRRLRPDGYPRRRVSTRNNYTGGWRRSTLH